MSDSEYEEETTYVVFDLGNAATTDYVEEVSNKIGGCRIIGLEEGRPYLQLGDITLEGTVDETIGTHLLFEMQDRGLDSTNILSSITPSRADTEPKELRKALKYECSTENVITLETVTLTPKSSAPVRNSTKEGGNDSSIIDAIF